MRNKRIVILASLICIVLNSSCGNKPAALPQAPVKNSPEVVYETSTYCFNGTSIVSVAGKWGIVDTLGHIIMPVVYDHIAYITDDMVEASEGDLHYLADSKGNILAETRHRGAMDESTVMDWAAAVAERARKSWDEVLDSYEELASLCLSASPDEKAIQAKADKIREQIEEIRGSMTKDQRARFELIRSSFEDFS